MLVAWSMNCLCYQQKNEKRSTYTHKLGTNNDIALMTINDAPLKTLVADWTTVHGTGELVNRERR